MSCARLLLFLGSLVFLQACGGADAEAIDAVATTRPPPEFLPGFLDHVQYANDLAASSAGLTVSDPITLPVSGSATYSGIMLFSTNVSGSEANFAGTLAMVSDFENDQVVINVGNVHDENDKVYAGTLNSESGLINRDADVAIEHTFHGPLSGTLVGGDIIEVTAQIAGDFQGGAAEAINGVMDGAVSVNGITGAIYGGFWAD